ncbi:MAG: choice-of-anchor D domain-containing protein, partial [Bacteroidota bacterium]
MNNTNGIVLAANLTVNGTVTFVSGKIVTNNFKLKTVNAVSGANASNFIAGYQSQLMTNAAAKIFNIGQGTDYLPLSATVTTSGSDYFSASVLDRTVTAPGGSLGNGKVLKRYYRAQFNGGLSPYTALLTLSYSDADLSTIAGNESNLRVFQWDGSSWSEPVIASRNTGANTITVSGITKDGDFVLVTSSLAVYVASKNNFTIANTQVNFTTKDTVVISNTGTTPLVISSLTISNPQFTVTPANATIAPAANEKFVISFTPTSIGTKNLALIFSNDGGTAPDTVFATGRGVLPVFSLSPTAKSYGNVLQGSNKLDSVNVTNTGDAALVISTITSVNADFVVTPNANITLQPAETQKFYVTFTPSTVATKTGNIIFTYNDAVESPDTLFVSGIGSVPGFGLSTTLVDFGKLRKSKSKMDSVTVENTGVINLNITGVTSDVADFTVTPTSATVIPSAIQKFYITFTPASVGALSANIRFAHDGSKPADTVVAKGIGIMPIYLATKPTGDFGNVYLGKSKTDSLYIKNTGTDTLHLDSLHHSRSEFTWVMTGKTQYAIAPGDSNKSVVTFTPVSLGAIKDTFPVGDEIDQGV